ncbi:MAG: hypothetical protein AB8G77_16705 [Rhodothermales bacterium]
MSNFEVFYKSFEIGHSLLGVRYSGLSRMGKVEPNQRLGSPKALQNP